MIALNEARSLPGMSAIFVLSNLLWIIFGGLRGGGLRGPPGGHGDHHHRPAMDKSGLQHGLRGDAALGQKRSTRGLWT